MNTTFRNSIRRVTLMQGDHYVSARNVIIETLLGSCVSACLYDPVHHIVGMNHFLLSGTSCSRSLPLYLTEAGRYGVNAMELIINGMLRLGAEKKNLRAKAFGGASQFSRSSGNDKFSGVGEINSRFVVEFLQNEGIELVAEDLRGDQGRVITFHSRDFSVHRRKIPKTIVPDLAARERRFWEQEAAKGYAEPEL
jgi:chemotaxis protein CheD